MVSFEATLLTLALCGGAGGETALLDFYADWCGPCQQMNPVVEQLAARGYPVCKVNFDRNRQLAAKYGVDRLPSFVLVVDGRVVDRVVGATSFARLEQMCKIAQARRQKREAAEPKVPAPVPLPPVEGEAGWRLPPSGGGSGASGSEVTDAELIAVTVRLRIEDPAGQSCGSGTLIDARRGEALILTCGHLFRESEGKGRIEVDLFGPTPAEGIPGWLLMYDLEHDIALLTIRTPGPLKTAQVAPAGYRVGEGDRVANVGCNNGEPPSVRRSRVTSLNRYQGPPNLQVSGRPVLGRSGGGLFSSDGRLIGVCNAADPQENEGLYAALESVQAQLDRAELSYVYQSGGGSPAPRAPLVVVDPPPMPEKMPPSSEAIRLAAVSAGPADAAPMPGPAASRQGLSEEERAALEEIRRRAAQGAEVICVIRSLSDPQAPSEIIVLEEASPAFLRELAGDAKRRDAPHLTSLEIPRRPSRVADPAGTNTAGSAPSAPTAGDRSNRPVRSR